MKLKTLISSLYWAGLLLFIVLSRFASLPQTRAETGGGSTSMGNNCCHCQYCCQHHCCWQRQRLCLGHHYHCSSKSSIIDFIMICQQINILIIIIFQHRLISNTTIKVARMTDPRSWWSVQTSVVARAMLRSSLQEGEGGTLEHKAIVNLGKEEE